MGNWKKVEDEKGFIYYTNKELNTQQWDHPKYCEIKQGIDDCNYVAYATYRLALKFRILQRCLYMEEVPLSIITATFEKHRLGNNESSLILETYDLEALLSDIFFAANKKNHTNIDVDFATELMINFLYNVFDSYREGRVQVISTKMILGILSRCSLSDLYKYLFSICADHNNCITRIRLQGLLSKIHVLIKYLHEDSSFGLESLSTAIESCFQDSPGMVGITEGNFIHWLSSDVDVPFLSWLPLVLKLKSAETVLHSVRCSTCNTRPILGLRYRCTKCLKYTQCQRCFLTGRISRTHKLSHSLLEYSTLNSNQGSINKLLSNNLCGLLCPRTVEKNYSVVKPGKHFANENIKSYQSTDVLYEVEPLSSPEGQLQAVIRQLESQNRELQQMLIFGNYSDKEMRQYLDQYRHFMAANIKRLKMLKNRINNLAEHDLKPLNHSESICLINTQSTPTQLNGKIEKPNNTGLQYSTSSVTMMTEIYDNFYNDAGKEGGSSAQLSAKSDFDVNNCVWNKGYQSSASPATIEPQNNDDVPNSPVKLSHNGLDEALAKLQQILANNFSLEDSVNNLDNSNLKYAVTEVEGMLTSIIDNVESSRCNSTLPVLSENDSF